MYGMGGNGGMGGSLAPGGAQVKDLAPVHVTAQTPRQPGIFGSYMQWANDHPTLSKMAEGLVGSAIPTLGTVFAGAHAYYNSQHGRPLFGNMFGKLGGSVSDMLGAIGSGPGGPLSSNQQNPLYKDLDSSFFNGSGSPGGGGFGSSYYDSQLPNYPGLASVSAYPLSGDMGGYWNQQAIHDAAPTYGPFAGS